MLRRGWMAVCWCVVASAGPVAAESVVPAPGRIARLIAERGAIRRQLEASYPSAGADLARAVLGESAEGLAPARDTNAHAQAGSRRRGGFPYGLVLVLMAVGALILYLNVVANFDP
jgi:hypothetical protein